MTVDPEERAVLVARDDQQTAAILDCEDEMREMVAAVDAAANALLEHGLPPHMVVSNLTGIVAARVLITLTQGDD